MRYGLTQQKLQSEAEWQKWYDDNKQDLYIDLDKADSFPCVVVWHVDSDWGGCYVEYVYPFGE